MEKYCGKITFLGIIIISKQHQNSIKTASAKNQTASKRHQQKIKQHQNCINKKSNSIKTASAKIKQHENYIKNQSQKTSKQQLKNTKPHRNIRKGNKAATSTTVWAKEPAQHVTQVQEQVHEIGIKCCLVLTHRLSSFFQPWAD